MSSFITAIKLVQWRFKVMLSIIICNFYVHLLGTTFHQQLVNSTHWNFDRICFNWSYVRHLIWPEISEFCHNFVFHVHECFLTRNSNLIADVIWQEIKPKHFYCLGFSARATQVEKYPNSGPLFHPCAAASLTKLVSHDDDAFRSWDLFAGYNAGGTTQVILSSLEID